MSTIVVARLCWLVCLAILIATFGCGEESEDGGGKKAVFTPVDLLPYDNDISGWESVGAYEEANDYDALDVIDDEAEVFIDNGFVSAAFQQYASGALMVHLRIYDQGTEANAQATYDRVGIGFGIPWNGAGIEARIDETGLATYMVEFWQRNMFVQIIIEDKTDEALNVAKLFASHVSDRIG